jgi:hypothetical protein
MPFLYQGGHYWVGILFSLIIFHAQVVFYLADVIFGLERYKIVVLMLKIVLCLLKFREKPTT